MTTHAPSNLEEVNSPITNTQNSSLERTVAGAVLAVTLALSGQPATAETTAQLEAARQACINETRERSASLLRRVESLRGVATEMRSV